MSSRIKDLREDRDITQKEISRYLMCDQSLYSKYERGERVMTMDILERLAKYYNTSADYLIGLTDEKAPYPRAKSKKI